MNAATARAGLMLYNAPCTVLEQCGDWTAAEIEDHARRLFPGEDWAGVDWASLAAACSVEVE